MKWLALGLVLLVLLSGCVSTEKLSDIGKRRSVVRFEKGVVIKEFYPEFTEVRSGDVVRFKVKMKNEGSELAENGFAELLGIDYEFGGGEIMPNEEKCRYGVKGITLKPGNREKNIRGEEAVCTWNYKTPEVKVGTFKDYKPRARVFYDYKSYTVKRMNVLTRDEIIRYKESGKPLPLEPVKTSNAPVEINVEAKTPVVVTENGVKFPLQIHIKNVGGGTVCPSSEECRKPSGGKWNRMSVRIKTPAWISLENCGEMEDVELINDEQTITCKLDISNIEQQIIQADIEVVAKYGYFIERETNLRVLPRL